MMTLSSKLMPRTPRGAVDEKRKKREGKRREEKGKGGRRKERRRLLFAVIGVLFHAGVAEGKARRRRRF
jgi:hypothetical protein